MPVKLDGVRTVTGSAVKSGAINELVKTTVAPPWFEVSPVVKVSPSSVTLAPRSESLEPAFSEIREPGKHVAAGPRSGNVAE